MELRELQADSIRDEVIFIARASEGAISVEWLYGQPAHVRKKYCEQFKKELEERKQQLDRTKSHSNHKK